MNRMDLYAYREKKDHPVRLKIWRAVNAMAFWWCGTHMRKFLLRMFGAKIGGGCMICRGVKVYAPWNLAIGEMVCVGPNVELYNKDAIEIGCGVVISQDSYLCTASHDIGSPEMALTTGKIVIEDNVWVAAKASILPGVTLHEGCVVGACAVSAKDVPEWTVVVGNPAQAVGKRTLREKV